MLSFAPISQTGEIGTRLVHLSNLFKYEKWYWIKYPIDWDRNEWSVPEWLTIHG